LVVLLIACKKDAPSQPAPAPPPVAETKVSITADAAVADRVASDAGPALVELLHAVPSTVRVSSKVRNKAIKPQHLVDRDLQTAWNSMTGDLVGAWIEVPVPGGATVEEIRLTVGHTGKGKKGEDWFLMNPRIRRVIVTVDGKDQPPVELDITKRGLQSLRVHATTSARVTIDAVELGTKKSWRETCVSELEVWGAPPAGWTAPAKPVTPTVEVGEPPDGSGLDALCAGLDQEREEYAKKLEASEAECARQAAELPPEESDHCMVDYPGPPDCDVATIAITDEAKPWTGAGVLCSMGDNIYGPKTCSIAVAANGKVIDKLDIDNGGLAPSNTHWDVEVFDARVQDVIAGGAPELVLRYRLVDRDDTDRLVVCRPTGCGPSIALAGDGWTVQAAFVKGEVVLTTAKGSPPPEALGKRAVF
jgi:hypothetical protein